MEDGHLPPQGGFYRFWRAGDKLQKILDTTGHQVPPRVLIIIIK